MINPYYLSMEWRLIVARREARLLEERRLQEVIEVVLARMEHEQGNALLDEMLDGDA